MKTDYTELISLFIEHLKIINRSSNTISIYTHNIKEYCKTVNGENIKGVTRDEIEKYISTLYNYRYSPKRENKKNSKKTSPYSQSTISIKIRSIKRFFEYLEYSNIIFINPSENIKEPKKKRVLPKSIMTPEETKKILDRPNLGTLTGIRDRAILETFYSTGIRINELCSLTIYDVDLQGGIIKIKKGKGTKDRAVPMGKHAIRFIREYITKVRPRLSRHDRTSRYLFLGIKSRPIKKQMVSILIRKYAKETGIKKQITAHTFRHTFATELIKNGADIRAVQKMLGHKYLKTTQCYVNLAVTNLKKEHGRTHPRS